MMLVGLGLFSSMFIYAPTPNEIKQTTQKLYRISKILNGGL